MTSQEYTDILSERISDCIAHGYDYAPIIERGKDDYISEKITEMIYHSIWKRKDISIAQLIEHLVELGVTQDCIVEDGKQIVVKMTNVDFSIRKSEAYRLGVKIGFCVGGNLFDVTRNEENAIARMFFEINDLYPQWEQEWNEIFVEISKQTKNIDISILSIDAIVRNKLKGSNLPFHIEHLADESKMSLLIENNRQITLTIPHDKITETIATLQETIQHTTELLRQIPSSISISANTHDDWETI
jgi:hypothetical protein